MMKTTKERKIGILFSTYHPALSGFQALGDAVNVFNFLLRLAPGVLGIAQFNRYALSFMTLPRSGERFS